MRAEGLAIWSFTKFLLGFDLVEVVQLAVVQRAKCMLEMYTLAWQFKGPRQEDLCSTCEIIWFFDARTVSLQVAITHKFRRHLVDLQKEWERNRPKKMHNFSRSAWSVPLKVPPCPTLPLQLSVSVDWTVCFGPKRLQRTNCQKQIDWYTSYTRSKWNQTASQFLTISLCTWLRSTSIMSCDHSDTSDSKS